MVWAPGGAEGMVLGTPNGWRLLSAIGGARVTRLDKTLERVLRGTSDADVGFTDLCRLLAGLGFDERIRGSHHIFTRDGVPEILNLQPVGGKAKPYQVKQVRRVIVRRRLGGLLDAEPE
jgi:hypothetical protein